MNVKHQWQYMVHATCLISLPVSLQIQFYFLKISLETKLQNNWSGDRAHWATTEAILSVDIAFKYNWDDHSPLCPLPNPCSNFKQWKSN